MRQTEIIMGMPVTLEIAEKAVDIRIFSQIFNYLHSVDARFSTYKNESEISQINRGEIKPGCCSREMTTIFRLAEETKEETDGYFDIGPVGKCDPSGIVKGWAMANTAQQLDDWRIQNFYLEIAGDIQVRGKNKRGLAWQIGIRHPFQSDAIIKTVSLSNEAIATSGIYERGSHIYNPKTSQPVTEIVSLTVIGENILDTDRFATAAFAMGRAGIHFIENLPGFEGYMVDEMGVATMTSNFERYTV